MAFSFIAASNATGTGVTSLSINMPAGTTAGDLVVIAYAFEGVATASGPWTIPNVGQFGAGLGPALAWQLLAQQSPPNTGTGLEVWGAIYSSGALVIGNYATSRNVAAVAATYRGEYNPTGNILGAMPRLAPTMQVTGNQPSAPSVLANSGELIVAAGADTMTGAGYGTPSGFTNRVDQARAGAGTAEATLADRTASVTGNTGLITFPNNASGGTAAGGTATLVFQPQPTTVGDGAVIDAGLPQDLDISDGFTLRVTALDPTSGNPVSGVTVSNLILTVDQLSGTPDQLTFGPFMLVPGPGA